MNKYILCPICNKPFKSINNAHLKMHGINITEFRIQHPEIDLKSEEVHEKEKLNGLNFLKAYESKRQQKEDDMQKYYQTPLLCKNCNKIVPYRNRKSVGFCSQSCSASFNNRTRVRKSQYPINIICKYCGKQTLTHYQKNRKYCSNACSIADKKQRKWKEIANGKKCSQMVLRDYLLETRGNKCEKCNQSNIWNNELLSMQIHHKDGNKHNNNLDNLLVLCPNCHTQTDNWGFKTRKQI